jgi:hypothetical protein
MFYSLNVKLPSLPKVSLHQEDKPAPKKAESATKSFITRESKITPDSEILAKVSQATGMSIASVKDEQTSGSLLKDILRKKLENKLPTSASGEHARAIESKPRRQIQFS